MTISALGETGTTSRAQLTRQRVVAAAIEPWDHAMAPPSSRSRSTSSSPASTTSSAADTASGPPHPPHFALRSRGTARLGMHARPGGARQA
jgi:hypothetical protein